MNDNYQMGRTLGENGITLASSLDKPESIGSAYSNVETIDHCIGQY